jgi:hypothetical protein
METVGSGWGCSSAVTEVWAEAAPRDTTRLTRQVVGKLLASLFHVIWVVVEEGEPKEPHGEPAAKVEEAEESTELLQLKASGDGEEGESSVLREREPSKPAGCAAEKDCTSPPAMEATRSPVLTASCTLALALAAEGLLTVRVTRKEAEAARLKGSSENWRGLREVEAKASGVEPGSS